MVRKLMTTALILTLGLSLAACGNQDTGTTANRWRGTNAASQNWAIEQQNLARGPLDDSTGAYSADADGRVKGYDTDSADGSRTDAGDSLKDAGKDLGDAAKDAAKGAGDTAKDIGEAAKDTARSIGDAAEDTLDGMTDAAKDTANSDKTAKN